MTVPQRPPIQRLLIDLDDTLYDCPELPAMVADNIREYMKTKLDISPDVVEEKCRYLYLQYGTTLAGLVASGYTIDFDEWHAFVHGRLPYEKYLKSHPKLRALLDSLPMEKYVFTNADRCHASKCLDLMGIKDCFQGVICFESIMETAHEIGISHHNKPAICKPNRMAFEIALSQAGGASAATTAFFDDSTRNIASAHHIGLFSVLVGRTGVDCASHVQMESMLSLPSHLPWLLQVVDDTALEESNNSVEDGVLAVEKA